MPESSSSDYNSTSKYPAWYFEDAFTIGSSSTAIPAVDWQVRLSDLPDLSDIPDISLIDSHRPTLAVETGYTHTSSNTTPSSSAFSSLSYCPSFSPRNDPYPFRYADPWSPLSPRALSHTSPSLSNPHNAVPRTSLRQDQGCEFQFDRAPVAGDDNNELSPLACLIEYSTPDVDDRDDEERLDYPPRDYGPIRPPPPKIQEVVFDPLSPRYVARMLPEEVICLRDGEMRVWLLIWKFLGRIGNLYTEYVSRQRFPGAQRGRRSRDVGSGGYDAKGKY
ncbi:hypothetical protein QBC47DRAFT_432390 [Echria macrotheca]|uniref:Uncharacterized protein n=1 Tax=Echria macrotheca TaxID=438768 RepID=A0AAJ0B9L8_9PEZI|nr:hypothetical protein QBC47DRAFT_432390 [Echria macrotheca]